MKLLISIVFFSTSVAFSQHPEDLVSSDSLAILSIQDGDAIQKSLDTISTEFTGTPINDLMAQFIKNPSAIDYSKGVLLSVEPNIKPGISPAGMFGAMPRLVVICKPKENQSLEINTFSGVNISETYDGWFIAAGGTSWTAPDSGKISPIFSELKGSQINLHIQFKKLWSKLGPIAQMTGGMMIGQLNKPGIKGVIDPKTRKQTAAISQAFRKLMQFCTKVETISASISMNGGIVHSTLELTEKNPQDLRADNLEMKEMASVLHENALQYAISGDLTRLLLDYNFASMGLEFNEYPILAFTEGMRSLADIQGDNVVTYNLNEKRGMSIAALAEVTDANEYLERAKKAIDEMRDQLASEFHMKLTPDETRRTTWNVKMLGETAADLQIMQAVLPPNTIVAFRKVDNRVGFTLGQSSYNPFESDQVDTDLSRLIASEEDLEVEFAMTMDARKFIKGMVAIEIAGGVNSKSNAIPHGPSAITKLILGTTPKGWAMKFQLDLAGLSKVMGEIN